MTPDDRETREQCITAAFVVITIFAVLCALASSAGADDSAYLRARAAIAINASLVAKPDSSPNVTTGQSVPKPDSGSSKPPAKAKPEIWTYYAPFHCDPCETQKADIKAWKAAPFAFRNGDVNNAPVVIESYPTTAWKVDGRWWSYSGWHGIEHLEREWTRSNGKAITQQSRRDSGDVTGTVSRSRTLALKQFAASYRGPTTGVKGSTLSHLMEPKHGFAAHELQGLTEWELERLHSAVHHYGLHASRLRAMANQRGM